MAASRECIQVCSFDDSYVVWCFSSFVPFQVRRSWPFPVVLDDDLRRVVRVLLHLGFVRRLGFRTAKIPISWAETHVPKTSILLCYHWDRSCAAFCVGPHSGSAEFWGQLCASAVLNCGIDVIRTLPTNYLGLFEARKRTQEQYVWLPTGWLRAFTFPNRTFSWLQTARTAPRSVSPY